MKRLVEIDAITLHALYCNSCFQSEVLNLLYIKKHVEKKEPGAVYSLHNLRKELVTVRTGIMLRKIGSESRCLR